MSSSEQGRVAAVGSDVPVIDLGKAPGARVAWGRPTWVVLLWGLVERLLVTNALQVSSRLRVAVLRRFGARIGDGVILRPGLRVKFPWKLTVGDRCWIGENVWLHNQDQLSIGHDAVVSQGTFITTGSHAHRKDMGLITRPVVIGPGAWVTACCVITGGVTIGRSALVTPNSTVQTDVAPNIIVGSGPLQVLGERFLSSKPSTHER